MFIQGGYATLPNTQDGISNYFWGIGGRLHFNIGNNFRIGTAGTSINLDYQNENIDGSFLTISYGGITAELYHRFDFIKLALGTLIGGGGITNLHIQNRKDNNISAATYDYYVTFIVSPMFTCEFFLSETICVFTAIDYLFGSNIAKEKTFGPKLYIGVMFNK